MEAVARGVMVVETAVAVREAGSSGGGSSGGGGGDNGSGGDGGDSGGGYAGGCDEDGSQGAAHPFGNHARPYTEGSLVPDHMEQAFLDGQVTAVYQQWKQRYFSEGCVGSESLIKVGLSNSITVSEAHGYGMLIMVYMAGYEPDAKLYFDRLYTYYRSHGSVGDPDLMAWSQDQSCTNNQGGHSATDGDLDIAFALLLADKQWGSGGEIDYLGAAMRMISSIEGAEVDDSFSYLRLGDWTSSGDTHFYNATRASDFMPGALASFESVTGESGWGNIIDRSYDMVASLQSEYSAQTGLLPDFIRDPLGDPYPAGPDFLERPVDGEYSFNACRVPWRLGVHYLIHGDSRARTALQKIDGWLRQKTGGDPYSITSGYWLDGDTLPSSNYLSMTFLGPFAVGAMAGGDQNWVNALWGVLNDYDDGVYYADTLKLLSMIAMSGNWWDPQFAPCP